MAENIEIKIQDKVAPSISTKIRDIANRAREAYSAVKSLQEQLNTLRGNAIDQITRATNTATRAIEQGATASAKLAREQSNAATAAQKLATEQQRTATQTSNAAAANDRAALAALRLQLAQDKASNSFKSATSVVNDYVRAVAGVGLLLTTLGTAVNANDSFVRYNAVLKNATTSQQEFNKASAETLRIANESQSDVSTVTKVYARFQNSLREFGASQQSVINVTEVVSKALLANGATAAETSSAMLQLSQAFGAGRLNGDEFRAMAESAPPLMRDLAKAIGVPTGELKKMSAEGKLTTDVLLKAWDNPELLAKYREQAANITTLSGAWQRLKNEIQVSFGTFEQSIGFFNRLAISTTQLAQGIAMIRNYLKTDQLAKLNEELRTTTTQLAAYDKADPLTQLIVGGPKERAEILAHMNDLIKKIKELNTASAQTKSNNNLETKAVIDRGWMDKQFKSFDKLKDKNDKAAESKLKKDQENAIKLRDLQLDIITDYEQEARDKREKAAAESLKDAQREIEWITEGEDSLARLKRENSEKVYLYKLKLEDELNSQAKKFEDMQIDAQYKRIEDRKKREQTANDQISRSLTDALLRGFESGKSFAENFKDTLINMFKTLVLKPAIEFVLNWSGISGFLGSLSSSENSNQTSSSNPSGSGLTSLVKNLKTGFDSLNGGISKSIEKLGVFLSNGQGGLGDKLGGFLGQYSNQISNALGYAGAAYAGLNYIKQGNYAGAALTAAGAYFGGPAGAAIASAVGGLFGKKASTPRYSSGVDTTYTNGTFSSTNLSGLAGFKKDAGGRDNLSAAAKTFSETLDGLLKAFGITSTIGTNLQFFKRKGAWGFASATVDGVSSGSVGGDSVYSKDTQEAFNNLISAFLTTGFVNAIKVSKLPEGIKELFDGLTDKTQISNMIAATANLAKNQDALLAAYNLSTDAAGKVSVATGLTGEDLIAFVNKLTTTSLSLQSVGATILKQQSDLTNSFNSITGNSTLPTTLQSFDSLLKTINTTSSEGIKQFSDLFALRDAFAALTNTIDSLKTGVSDAIYSISTPSEQLAIKQANLVKTFQDLNLEVPGSLQELINLGKTIDFTTEKGLTLASVFPTLVQAFNETQTAAKSWLENLSTDQFTTYADYASAKNSSDPYAYMVKNAETNTAMLAEIQQMKEDTSDNSQLLTRILEYIYKQAKITDEWNQTGMPPVRTE